jgi:hypothetical protein
VLCDGIDRSVFGLRRTVFRNYLDGETPNVSYEYPLNPVMILRDCSASV